MRTIHTPFRYGLAVICALSLMFTAYALTPQDQGFCNINFQDGLTNVKHVIPLQDLRNALLSSFFLKHIDNFSESNAESVKQAVLEAFNAEFGTSRSKFRIKRVHVDEAKNRHYILNQFIDSVPVMGSQVAIHMTKDGDPYEVTGQCLCGTAPSVAIHIDSATAVMAAKKILLDGSTVNTKKGPALVIAGNRLAWHMYLSEPGADGIWDMLVDALTEVVVQKMTTVRYYGFPPGYPDSGQSTTIHGYRREREGGDSVSFIGWNATDSRYYLFNDSAHWKAMLGDFADSLASYTSSDWDTTNRAFISLAKNLSLVQAFAIDSLGQNSYDNSGSMLKCFYGRGGAVGKWNCAPASKMEIFFCDSLLSPPYYYYSAAAADIIGHEFGHALSEYNAGLGGYGDNGAINEAYSDIFATCFEQTIQADVRDTYPAWEDGQSDWLHGEDVFIDTNSNKWFGRNSRDPLNYYGYDSAAASLYFGAAWHISCFGGIHDNSNIVSFAFYLLSEGVAQERVNDSQNWSLRYGPFLGLGISTARRIAWGAQFNGRIDGNSYFQDARNAWIVTARELGYDAGVVAQVWVAIGMIDRTVNDTLGSLNDLLPGNDINWLHDPFDPTIPNHHTIQAAIDSADTGDLIYVYPDTYNENITIPADKPDLTIVGQNRDITILNGTVTVNASGFTMVGFTVDGQDSAYGIKCLEVASISGNRIRNCDTGIYLNAPGYKSLIVNNVITDCNGSDLHYLGGGQAMISDNEFLGKGIKMTEFRGGNLVYRNLFDKITGNGIELYGGASPYLNYNWLKNISQNTLYGNTNTLTMKKNVLTSPSGVSFTIDSLTNNGNIFQNNFNGPSYSFSIDTSVLWDSGGLGSYWNNYTGQDTDADSVGETNLPHQGVDSFPLMYRPVSPFVFSHTDTIRMMSSVTGEDFKIRDTVTTTDTTQYRLRFGNNASLTVNGKLQCSKFLAGSDKWMNTSGNLTGCLVWWNLEGKPVMCVDTAGVVRTNGSLTPKF